MKRVLVVDDDRPVREALAQTLMLADLTPLTAASFIEAKDHITPAFAGVILSDMRMPGRDGFHLMQHARTIDPDLPVIILTGEGDVPMAVQAIQAGAFGFLEKPCGAEDMVPLLRRALHVRAMVLEHRALRETPHITVQGEGLAEQMAHVERELLLRALRRAKGRAAVAAEELDLPRKTFYDKLARFGLRAEDYRG